MKYFYICVLTWCISDAIPLNNGYYRKTTHHKDDISRAFNVRQHQVRGQFDNLEDYQINTPIRETSHFQVKSNDYKMSIRTTFYGGNSAVTQRKENDHSVPPSYQNYQKVFIQTHKNVPLPNQAHNSNYIKVAGSTRISIPIQISTHNVLDHNFRRHTNYRAVRFPLCSGGRHYKIVGIETSNVSTTTPKTDTNQIIRDLNNGDLPGIWSFPDSPFDTSDEIYKVTSVSEIPVAHKNFSENNYNEQNNETEIVAPSPTLIVEATTPPNYNNSVGEVDKHEMMEPTPQPNDKDFKIEFKNNFEKDIKPTAPQPVDNQYNGVVDPTGQPTGNKPEVDDDRREIIEPTTQTNDNNVITPLPDNSKSVDGEDKHDIVELTPPPNDTKSEDANGVHEIIEPIVQSKGSNFESESENKVKNKIVLPTSLPIDNKNSSKDHNGYEVVEPIPKTADSKPEVDDVGNEIAEATPQLNDNNFAAAGNDENVILPTTPQPVDSKNYAESEDDNVYVIVEPTPQPADSKPELDDNGYEIAEPTPQPNWNNSVAESVDDDGYEIVEPTPQPNWNNSIAESVDDNRYPLPIDTIPKDAKSVHEIVKTTPKPNDSYHVDDDGHEIVKLAQPNENNSVAQSIDNKENTQPVDTKADTDYGQKLAKPTPQPNDSKSEHDDNSIVEPIYHRDDKKSVDENKIITSSIQPDDNNNFEDAVVNENVNVNENKTIISTLQPDDNNNFEDAVVNENVNVNENKTIIATLQPDDNNNFEDAVVNENVNVNENSIASSTANSKDLGKAATEDATGVIDIYDDYDIPMPAAF